MKTFYENNELIILDTENNTITFNNTKIKIKPRKIKYKNLNPSPFKYNDKIFLLDEIRGIEVLDKDISTLLGIRNIYHYQIVENYAYFITSKKLYILNLDTLEFTFETHQEGTLIYSYKNSLLLKDFKRNKTYIMFNNDFSNLVEIHNFPKEFTCIYNYIVSNNIVYIFHTKGIIEYNLNKKVINQIIPSFKNKIWIGNINLIDIREEVESKDEVSCILKYGLIYVLVFYDFENNIMDIDLKRSIRRFVKKYCEAKKYEDDYKLEDDYKKLDEEIRLKLTSKDKL